MNQLAISVPECSPLRAHDHAIVAEDRIHMIDGVFEHGAWA